MKATLIYGYEGSGKSRFVYDMCKNAGAKSVFIVPDQYTHQTELDIISALGSCGITDTEVLSFKRLSHRLKLLYGGASVIMMSNEGKTMLLNAIVNRLRNDNDNALLKNAAFTDIIPDMVNLISKLKQYDISPEALENCNIDSERYSHTKAKLSEVAKVYREYLEVSKQVAGMAFTDTEDDMELLRENIEKNHAFADTDVYIDGFDDFVRPELNVIKALIMHAKSVTITLPCENDVTLNRGLLFYRQKKMISAIEHIVESCNIEPQKIVITDKQVSSDVIAVPAAHCKSEALDFLEANLFSVGKKYENSVNDIVIYQEQSAKDEVEHIADRILHIVRDNGYRFSDMAVVCTDAQLYSRYIAKSFEDRDIPYFMDVKRNIRNNAVICFVVGLLDIVCKKRNTDSVLAFLKSGLLTNAYGTKEQLLLTFNDIAYLEKYCNAYYIKSKDWAENFKYGANFYDIDRLNSVRECVMNIISPFEEAMSNAKTAAEHAVVLENYLQQMNINDIVNAKITYLLENSKTDIAAEYSAVWNTLSETLNQISIFMGDTVVSHEEFTDVFKKSFADTTVNIIPACIDQVTVLEKSRTMSKHIKALFIMGAENIGIADESGIFNMSELELLKINDIDIGADKNNSICDAQYYIYKILSKPTDLLYISSIAISDKDENNSKSSLLTDALNNLFENNICRISGKRLPYFLNEADNRVSAENAMMFRRTTLENQYEDSPEIKKLDEWLIQNGSKRYSIMSNVVKKSIENLKNDINLTVSGDILLKSQNDIYSVDISRLERYVKCPYAYFARYGLNIKPTGKGKVSSIDIGNIVHDMLDGFVKNVLSKEESDENTVKAYIDGNFDKIVLEYQTGRISVTDENAYIIKRVKNILTQMMTIMLKRRSHMSTQIYATELKFDNNSIRYGGIPAIMCEDEEGTPFNITGKIDSVEYADIEGEKYWIINDYKTGKKPAPNMISSAKSLQLPIYLLAMLENNKDTETGAMFYINVNDNLINFDQKIGIEDIDEKHCGKSGIVADIEPLMFAIDNNCMDTKSNRYDLKASAMISNSDSLQTKKIEDMHTIVDNARKKACEIFTDIKNGKINKAPLTINACKYCEYRRLCGYVTKNNADTETEADGGDE